VRDGGVEHWSGISLRVRQGHAIFGPFAFARGPSNTQGR
jgi:hypothetical protein